MTSSTSPTTADTGGCTPAPRRPRADAIRNRGRLIAAAIDVFREQGLEAGVAEIAKRAGVGSATLFRNFPKKHDLVYTVIEQRMLQIIEISERAQLVEDPAAAFEQLLFEIADFLADDAGILEALQLRVIDEPELVGLKNRMIASGATVLARAQKAGAVRADVVPEDLSFLLMSAVRASDEIETATGLHRRYLRIILDGLRPEGASRLPVEPPPPDTGPSESGSIDP